MMAQVIGIDPGLVHTGVVSLEFDSRQRSLVIEHTVIDGPDAEQISQWLLFRYLASKRLIFVEKYEPRRKMDTDTRMVQAEQDLRKALPQPMFISNTGSRKVVTPQLMEVLGVWNFPTPTHHQDLRSAARIALFGMFKAKDTNTLIADVVRAQLDGNPWSITHV
jgi:hypothetical protein